ncbi:glycerophosphodiester phosphodiesterase [Microbacterium sp.]|uniref:glycerophosphodiester phosphodiesterase n=1 Tax=Microbacterium sp. TaxID=51671 RepID=UPI0039E55823
MSVRRRRLWGTGVIGVALCVTSATVLTPPAQATVPAAASHASAASTKSSPPSLLALFSLRPRVALREPGQPGAVVAHRGASTMAPENTLPAIAAAADAHADYVEIDIRMSSDGVPVVIHDSTVDRTTDGTGSVSALTLAELQRLDAGSWFSQEYAGIRIPTLEQVLALTAETRLSIVIEYKGRWTPAAIRTTVDQIAAADLTGHVITQSFNEKTVENISAVAPNLFVGWLTDRIDASIVRTAQRIGADAVNPQSTTPQGLADAHDAKLRVFVWTKDADCDWEELTALGVDGIITNTPSALTEWIELRSPAVRSVM